MKITPEQIAKLNNEQIKTQKNKATEDFSQILNQELEAKPVSCSGTSGTAGPLSPSIPPLLSPALLNHQQLETTLMNQVDQLLSKWENYAAGLEKPEADLRGLYATLQEISRQIKELKENFNLKSQKPELKSILEELEIMTTTEEIKFNRGDYI
ncbi:hypothetical protein [Desulfovulcanus sp.]